MKKIFNLFFVTLLAFVALSCTREEDKVTLNMTSEGTVSSDVATLVLDETIADNDAITFTWVAPTFNPNVATSNYLQFGLVGSGFSPNKLQALENGVNSFTFSHVDFNTFLNGLAVEGVPNQIEVRLVSEANETTVFYSESITITVTPYTPNPDLIYPKINVPGKYAGLAGYAEWNPGNTMNLYSPESDDKYRGFVFVNTYPTPGDYEYKFTINEDWAGDKGDDGTFSGILVESNESNCKFPAGGTYYLKVDWTGNTYSTAVANFGMIGDATPAGWGSDTDFVYNPVSKNWEIASIALSTSGVFKFRANDDWAMKFQPASSDETLTSNSKVKTFLSSEGTVSGDPSYKIDVAGNYKVVLDLHNSAYYNLTLIKL